MRRAGHDLAGPGSLVQALARVSQVCSWTDSPDGRFVLDRLLDGRVVLACGDSGEGFKFSALMGELLADLAEGVPPDPDVASFGLGRFAVGAGGASRTGSLSPGAGDPRLPRTPGSHGGCATGCARQDGRMWRTAAPESRGADVSEQLDDLDDLGPIDYVVVEWPSTDKMNGEALPLLVDLVDRGIIRLLDLAFIRKDLDGTVSGLEVADFDGDGTLDLAVFEGVSSGLIGDDDIEDAGSVIEPGSAAGIIVYENTWAAPFARALRRSGAQLVANGRIPVQAILASLDAADG